MYWNRLHLSLQKVTQILNQQHIMYWNDVELVASFNLLFEPTTYNVLKQLSVITAFSQMLLNQQHIMYWNNNRRRGYESAFFEPTTYNVLKPRILKILGEELAIEPTTYNVLKQ